MKRNLPVIIYFVFFLSSLALAQSSNITFIDEPYISTIAEPPADFSTGTPPPWPAVLEEVTDSLSDYTVGQDAVHQVGFQLPSQGYFPFGLLKGRQAVITFPPEFDLTAINSVSYFDTDDEREDPEIAWIYIYNESVVVRFSESLPSPRQPHFAFITINTIENPTEAREHRVVVQVDNYFAQTVAGPNHSDFFRLIPDEAEFLSVTPSEDLTMKAGEIELFEVNITDQYGNLLDDENVAWELDADLDQIGELVSSTLMATTVGTGRVQASYEDLTAYSGAIAVTPGKAASLELSVTPDTIGAGQSLNHDVEVAVFDAFGNLETDYIGQVWFTSDDSEAEFDYDEYSPYGYTAEDQGRRIFAHNGFVFQTAGPRVLSVLSDDGLSAMAQNIYVISDGELSFTVTAPEIVRAGDSFTVEITDAVDAFGNPYTGYVNVSGGLISPNGMAPNVQDIYVVDGFGSAEFRLFATGQNDVLFSAGEYSEMVTIEVMPGAASELIAEYDETQFLSHPFIDGVLFTVFDSYGNSIKELSSDLDSLVLTSSTGIFSPSSFAVSEFVDGELFIDDLVYHGISGLISFSAAIRGNSEDGLPEFQGTFYANGIMVEIDENYLIPDSVPQGWEYKIRGHYINNGNLKPSVIITNGGYQQHAIEDAIRYPDDCLPAPGMGKDCIFMLEPNTNLEPNGYIYVITSIAEYEYKGHVVSYVYIDDYSTRILPFEPLTILDYSLPTKAFAVEDTLTGSILLGNTNDYMDVAHITFLLDTEVNGRLCKLANFSGDYDWPNEFDIPLSIALSSVLTPGSYPYLSRYQLRLPGEDGEAMAIYHGELEIADSLTILERATFAVDGSAVTPASANVNTMVPFTFALEIIGQSTILLDGSESIFTITDGEVSSQVRISEDTYRLLPGWHVLTTMPMTMPANWLEKDLSASLRIIGVEEDVLNIDETINFDIPLELIPDPALQIISLDLDAPNVPFVNTGQVFGLIGKIVNNSEVDITTQMTIAALSDGNSQITPASVIESLSAGDTAEVIYSVTASESENPAERFYLNIISGYDDAVTEVDNDAIAVIQTPANLSVSAKIANCGSPVAVLDFNEAFIINAEYENNGQSEITGGTLLLDFEGSEDFGVQFPIEVSLSDNIAWGLVSPNVEFNSELIIRWGQAPIDVNTGKSVENLGSPVSIPFLVEASITRLVIQADSFDTQPLVRNFTSTLFKLSLENVTTDYRNILGIKTIMIAVTDRDGNDIDPGYIVDENSSGFYLEDVLVSEQLIIDGRLTFTFDDLILEAGQKKLIEFRLRPKTGALLDFFNMRLESEDISAEFISGPRTGQPVTVTGVLDRAFEISLPQAIIATEFAESFKNYPNPFNPMEGETEFIYNLPSDSDVDIYIYTATGERVRHLHYTAGSAGGQSDQLARAFWDGRNGDGEVVLNGVYIAYIEVAAGGLQAKLKMAVVK